MMKQKEGTTFFVVVRKESNGVRWQQQLTKPLHSRLQLRKALKRIQASVPNAQGVRIVSLC